MVAGRWTLTEQAVLGCLYGGALFFRVVFGWHIWVTVPTLLTMTGMYTIGNCALYLHTIGACTL